MLFSINVSNCWNFSEFQEILILIISRSSSLISQSVFWQYHSMTHHVLVCPHMSKYVTAWHAGFFAVYIFLLIMFYFLHLRLLLMITKKPTSLNYNLIWIPKWRMLFNSLSKPSRLFVSRRGPDDSRTDDLAGHSYYYFLLQILQEYVVHLQFHFWDCRYTDDIVTMYWNYYGKSQYCLSPVLSRLQPCFSHILASFQP